MTKYGRGKFAIVDINEYEKLKASLELIQNKIPAAQMQQWIAKSFIHSWCAKPTQHKFNTNLA